MATEIAVFVGKDGNTVSFYEEGLVVVYRKKQGGWNKLREQPFTLANSYSIRVLREKMSKVLSFLGTCKIFTGLSVVGVPYFELEKAGCSIWEFEGNPMQFLDYILEQEEATSVDIVCKQPITAVEPIEREKGCYYLSLKDIQNNNLGITSKQALQPFLRKGEFYQLEVLCNHVPPWLEGELLNLNLEGSKVCSGEGEVKFTIKKRVCEA